MKSTHIIERQRYISLPAAKPRPSVVFRLARNLFSLVVTPYVFLAAWLLGTPGMRIRLRCVWLGFRALSKGDLKRAAVLIANPMDSFRYFELDFVARATDGVSIRSFLDVSSPRLVAFVILGHRPGLIADMINPIAVDLSDTAGYLHALGLSARARTLQAFIEKTSYADASFDLITSISVVEHILDDSDAISHMWRLLRPGGRLLITVPCARVACEEFADLDEYGLHAKDRRGFVYWQRYYDEAALNARIWSVTGLPLTQRIYGEIEPGIYDANVVQKRTGRTYPFWWEPILMGRKFRSFSSLDALPGMGVIAMEFVKAPAHGHG